MKKHIDIYLGLLAWAIGIFTFITLVHLDYPYRDEWMLWGGPSLWLVCVIAMYVLRKRNPWWLSWVWLSFPGAFVVWGMLTLFILGQDN